MFLVIYHDGEDWRIDSRHYCRAHANRRAEYLAWRWPWCVELRVKHQRTWDSGRNPRRGAGLYIDRRDKSDWGVSMTLGGFINCRDADWFG